MLSKLQNKKSFSERLKIILYLLKFIFRTLFDSIMVTTTTIVASLYILFDGNLTNMFTNLLAMGDEEIKYIFISLFIPILFIVFASKYMDFQSLKPTESTLWEILQYFYCLH